MPVIGEDRINYCEAAHLVAFGVPEDQATDAVCDLASRVVEQYTGRTFLSAAVGTVTRQGAAQGRIPLPGPFTDVTEVVVNGVVVESDYYSVRPWGLQLNRPRVDQDGWPYYDHAYPRATATVEVTAVFGESTVPLVIAQATIILAAGFARGNVDDTLPSAQISAMDSGGLRLTFTAAKGATTGNREVDAMLAPFVYAADMVD